MGVKYFEPSFMRLQHLFDTRAVDDDDNLTKIGRMMSLETHSVFNTLFVYGYHCCGQKSPLLEKQARMFGLE
ncbi:hypothetical protein YC2023_022393 [Brassica napus]